MQRSQSLFSQFLFEMYAKVIVKETKYPKLYRFVINNSSSNFQNTKTISTA